MKNASSPISILGGSPFPLRRDEAISPLRSAGVALLAVLTALSLPATAQTPESSGSRNHEFNSIALTAQAATTDFGTVNIGSSASASVTFTFNSAETLGSIAVLTQGAPGKDFTNGGGGTCTAGKSYSAGNTCAVNVRFTPKVAGTRPGAVLLKDASGNVFATAFVHGAGIGPQIAYGPTAQTLPLQHSFLNGLGIAVDGNGDVFVADTNGERVIEIPRTASGYGAEIPLTSGLSDNVYGLAVDGAGNVFFGQPIAKLIVELPWTGSGFGAQITVAKGQSNVCCLAVDGSGNLYFTEWNNNQVQKLPWTGSGYDWPVTVPTSGLSTHLFGIAADVTGSVYVADSSCDYWDDFGCVWKVPWSNKGYGPQLMVASGLNPEAVDGVAVDGVGNVYIADTYHGLVVEAPWTGSGYGPLVGVVRGAGQFFAVAVDGAGSVYSNYSYGDVIYPTELSVSAPPNLSFATTSVGKTSADSPQSVEVKNIGNAPLDFTVPPTGTNPSIPANFSLGDSGTCPLVTSSSSAPGKLGWGESCTLQVSFTPEATGSIRGSLVLADNALNVNGARQEIQLSGTAAKAAQTINFLQPPSPVTYGVKPIALSAKASSGLAVSFSVVSGPAKVSGSTLTITGAGTVVVAANQAGNSDYAAAPQVTRSITVNKAVLTVFPHNLSKVYGSPLPALTYVLLGFVNGDTAAAATTGAPGLSTTATSKSAVGTYPIVSSQGTVAAPNYTFKFLSEMMTITKAVLTVFPHNLSKVYGSPLPTLTYVLLGFVNGDTPATATTGAPGLSTAATSKSAVGTYPIASSAGTLAAPNYSFKFLTETMTVTKAKLTVTANSLSMKQGAAVPTLTATMTGFVNGDTQKSATTGQPKLATTATSKSTPGKYPITVTDGTLAAKNYGFAFVDGWLTVTQ